MSQFNLFLLLAEP